MPSRVHRRAAQFLCVVAIAAAGLARAEPNPLARFAPPAASLVNGRWNGVDLERRSNCTSDQNNGSRGTYAQFDVSTDASGVFAIGQTGITGLNCNYVGRFQVTDNHLAVQGTYTCTDGKQGDFQTTSIAVSGTSLNIQMTIRLTGNESCLIDGILSMGRFPL